MLPINYKEGFEYIMNLKYLPQIRYFMINLDLNFAHFILSLVHLIINLNNLSWINLNLNFILITIIKYFIYFNYQYR